MSAAGMNNPSPAPEKPLVRPEKPVEVIGPQFIKSQQLVELTVSSNKVRSVGKFLEVADVEGTILFQIKNKVLTAHNRSFLHDAAGKIILNLRHKIKTRHGKWEVFRGESKDDLLFTAKRSSALRTDTRLHIFLPSNTTQEIPDYKIDGSRSDRLFTVSPRGSNSPIAEITLKKDKIAVKVAKNVDYAFIVTLVICLGSFDPPDSLRSSLQCTFAGVQIVLGGLGRLPKNVTMTGKVLINGKKRSINCEDVVRINSS